MTINDLNANKEVYVF